MPYLSTNHGTCVNVHHHEVALRGQSAVRVANLPRRVVGRASVFEGRFLGLAQQPVWAAALDPARDPANDLELLQRAGVALNNGRGLLGAVPGFDYALRNNTKNNESTLRAQREANNILHGSSSAER
jgi:hypothetical protein